MKKKMRLGFEDPKKKYMRLGPGYVQYKHSYIMQYHNRT